jgi:membrane protein involved in colicin uptake
MLRQQGIPAPQPQQPPQRQWIEAERKQAQVEEQLQAAREQAAREQAAQAEQATRKQAEQATRKQAEQAAWRARKKPQAQWGTQEKERWIAENEREKEKAKTDVLIHITALRKALTQAQQEAAEWTNENATEKAVIYVKNWEINDGKTLFDNYVNRLDKKQYDAAKVYVKEIAIAFKQIENDLKRMQERMQEGI